jgi:hypothetical protein
MAATNFTPISLYYSTTASAVPTSGNLVAGELALNTLDEKLYFKNSAGTVKLLASNAASTGTVSSVAATVPAFLSIAGSPITTSGTLAITLSGTALPVANGGTGLTTTPANGALDIGNGTGFTRTTLTAGTGVTITNASGAITINATGTGGTVTSVSGTGTVNGLTLTGTVTSSGNLTLGGTLSLVSPPAIGSTTPNTGAFSTLALAGAAAPVTASNERITVSNSYDATILSRLYGATAVTQQFLNSGWSLSTYGSGGAGFMVNGVNGIYSPSGGGQYITSGSFTAFGTLSANGFTNVSPTYTDYARISASGVQTSTGGASGDPYGAISVTGSANANNYSYFGLTRFASLGAGFGLTGSTGALGLGANSFWFGGSTGPAPSGVLSGSAYIAFNSSNFVTAGSATVTTSLGVGTAASGTTGEIRATNAVTAYYSDDRLKTRFGNIQNALEKVESLDGFYYEANETAQALGYIPKREVGVSAQSVQAVLPEVVVPAPIDDKYWTVHYDKLVPLLIEAIKELGSKVKVLENK